MASIPGKLKHRRGTNAELMAYLSNREMGYSNDDGLVYIKIDGDLRTVGHKVDSSLDDTSTNPVQNAVLAPVISELGSSKADKVADAVAGNLAVFDDTGNLEDSGTDPSDFATAAQGEKADTAVQDASYVHTDNNFTTAEKTKLAGIEDGADVNVQSDWEETDNSSDAFIKHKPTTIGVVAGDNITIATQGGSVVISATGQSQSDWSQTDTTAVDYIKNKPSNLVQDASYVHTDNNYTSAEKTKLAGIEDGAEVNAIEAVKVNGTALAPDSSRAVDVTVPVVGTATPLMDGIASVGSSSKFAREDHVHPTDTSRESVANKTTVVLGTSNTTYPTDKAVADFVNASISSNTANYISDNGEPFTSVADLQAYSGTVTNNDYAFVTGTDSGGTTYYDRYKATVSGGTVTWSKEYRLNNSSFTTSQWAAITSGVTSELVSSWNTHIADGDIHVTPEQKSTWSGKQNAIDDLATIRSGAAAGATAVQDASYVHTDNNFTTAEKTKLAGIEDGADVNVQSDWEETDNSSDAFIKHKPTTIGVVAGDNITIATQGGSVVISATGQSQSDWSQTDTTAVDYIKNKPTINYIDV